MPFMVCNLLACLVSVMKSTIGLMEIECYNSFIESFQNEDNFSPRESYPPMKISSKFGEPS